MIEFVLNAMLNKKTLFLFLALILPIGIFLFLRFFGKNEFTVKPLFVDLYPEVMEGCAPVDTIPYSIPDSIRIQLPQKKADLVLLKFGDQSSESANQIKRTQEQFSSDPVVLVFMPITAKSDYWKNCVFFLKDPFDLVLIDRYGVIRGQYNSDEREEIDRLITELSIILKKY